MARQIKSEMSALLTPMAVRIVLIERALRTGRPTFERLMSASGASRATLKRDMHLMRSELGAVIQYDRRSGGYRLAGQWAGVAAQLQAIVGEPKPLSKLAAGVV